MRIVSGEHKGFRFPQRNMPHARPTTDRAKEALFNILDQRYHYDELKVLDLYGGLGSIALEFCSRGVQNVTAVDASRKSVVYIKEVAEKLKAPLTVTQMKVLPFLKKTEEQYDIIFADPPYNMAKEIDLLISQLADNQPFTSEGVFILEHQSMSQINHPAITETRHYGQSTFSFFNFV
ncbi:MAG: methyltransferase [Bacteroidetes bacterium]|jgi:16S rRNA (guanine966-N2)-methyltransferase|nr:methyltransferase [Bacteroidota bacterium]